MRYRLHPHGFSLIELMVALGMTLGVTVAATTVLVLAIRTQQEGITQSELTRDAQLVMDVVSRDLAYLGAGVPRGFEADYEGNLIGIGKSTHQAKTPELNSQAENQLRPPIRIGRGDYLAFLGDAPYPNAELNGIGSVGMLRYELTPPLPEHDEVAVMSELSPCPPPGTAGGYDCVTTERTLMADVGGAPCNAANLNAPTCPWGLHKWQRTGVPITLVFGGLDGSWYRREWDPLNLNVHSSDQRIYIHLEHVYDEPRARLPRRVFQSGSQGGGMVAQLDRVFLSLEDASSPGSACSGWPCTLWRRQCWGWETDSTHPNDADFPRVGAPPIRSGSNPADCGAPNRGTAWERVMDDIESLTFAYYGADGSALAVPLTAETSAAARVVEVSLTLRRRLKGSERSDPFLRHRLTRRLWLENAGGLVTFPDRTSEARGGCVQDSTLPNECNPQ